MRTLAAEAPKLILIIDHCYLPSAVQEEGNPVLSVYQSDIVVYAPDLRLFFLEACADLLQITPRRMPAQHLVAATQKARRVPFWGAVYELNMRKRFGDAYFDE